MDSELKERFAANLRYALQVRGLSPGDFLKELKKHGMKRDKSTISRWITKKTGPNPGELKALRDYLGGVPLDLPVEEFRALCGPSQSDPHIRSFHQFSDDFEQFVLDKARTAKRVVWYSSICKTIPHTHGTGPLELQDEEFCERLHRKEISFFRVEIFFTEAERKTALADNKKFARANYQCRTFLVPPQPIPALNLRSYDQETFIVGAFADSHSPDGRDIVAVFDNRQPMGPLLKNYWFTLWSRSIPFP